MAVLFAFLLGVSVILVAYFLYDFSRQNFIRETEAAIDGEIAHILVETKEFTQLQRAYYIARKTREQKNPLYLYQGHDGQWLAGHLEAFPADVMRVTEGVVRFNVFFGTEDRTVAAKIYTFQDGTCLLIARDIDDILESQDYFKTMSTIIIIFMLVVLLISFFISTFVVRRINSIAATASDIMNTGDLSRRITINTSWDDLSNLAHILNLMFERIERLVLDMREVSNSIAHDLRTPLARLHARLEEASNACESNICDMSKVDFKLFLKETDHLMRIFNALLRISHIERNMFQENFTTIDLKLLLSDVIELYEPLAEEKEIKIVVNLEEGAAVTGNKDLLFQLFANILDNAIKFSPEGSVIDIKLLQQDKQWGVMIADQGAGIDASEHEKIFDQFYRCDKSRHTKGNGLGLRLVQVIANLHKANIILDDNKPGLQFKINFTA